MTPSIYQTSAPLFFRYATQRDCWFWAGWEPDRYYRRIGLRGTHFFGNGDWISQWRAALESEQTLDEVAKAGGTLLMTRFYKGMGPELEQEGWPALKEFVRLAHERDIRVLGYYQGRSLFGEFLFNERPEAAGWIARDAQGRRQVWGGTGNRFAPCLRNAGYLEMMEAIAEEGIVEIGLDGLHMDNNYTPPCYCDLCRESFRDWLHRRGDLEELTGLVVADFVEPPEICLSVDLMGDPLALLWVEFSVQGRLAFMQAIHRKVKAARPEAILTGNPAFMRSFASRSSHSLDPALEGTACDGVCIENGNRPRYSGGSLFTQADKLLMTEAAGLRAWVTSWARLEDGSGYGVPQEAQALWATLAEEFSFAHIALGNNWALRPAGDGALLLKDQHPEAWEEYRKAVRFFRKLEAQLPSGREQGSEVAFYLDSRSFSISPGGDALAAQAILHHLILRRVPLKIVFQHQSLPAGTRTVLIPALRALDPDELERLRTAALRQDAEVWLLGDSMVYDHKGVPLGKSRRAERLAREGMRRFPLKEVNWVNAHEKNPRYFQGTAPRLLTSAAAVVDEVVEALRSRTALTVKAPEGVLANLEFAPGGEMILHLRDLRTGESVLPPGAVRISLSGAPLSIRAIAPEWERDLPAEATGEGREITLPGFSHYCCLRLQRSFINK